MTKFHPELSHDIYSLWHRCWGASRTTGAVAKDSKGDGGVSVQLQEGGHEALVEPGGRREQPLGVPLAGSLDDVDEFGVAVLPGRSRSVGSWHFAVYALLWLFRDTLLVIGGRDKRGTLAPCHLQVGICQVVCVPEENDVVKWVFCWHKAKEEEESLRCMPCAPAAML